MSLQDGKLQLILLQVIDMPEHNPGDLGGPMRLGLRRTVFTTENSILSKFFRVLIFIGHQGDSYGCTRTIPLGAYTTLLYPAAVSLTQAPLLAACHLRHSISFPFKFIF